MSVFEKNSLMKTERELAIEQAITEAKKRMWEKTEKPEVAEFFSGMDGKNVRTLETHPQTDRQKVFNLSRQLMNKIKQNPQVITPDVRFFHPKQGL